MQVKDLSAFFNARSFEQEELELVLLSHFGRSGELAPRQIAYPSCRTAYALKLSYNKNAILERISSGPSFTDNLGHTLKTKLKQELADTTNVRVQKRILFSSAPVLGFFRYRDKFQLLPVGRDAPKPVTLATAHPFVFEYSYTHSTNQLVSAFRRAKQAHEWELLLAGLLRFNIHSRGIVSTQHWVVLPRETETEPLLSAYLDAGYTWPGYPANDGRFTTTLGQQPIAEINPNQYHRRLSGVVFSEKAMSACRSARPRREFLRFRKKTSRAVSASMFLV